MGPRFFKVRPQAGRPLAIPGLAQGLAWLEEAWRRIEIHDGHIDWHGHQPIIVLDKLQEIEEQIGANVEWRQVATATGVRTYTGPVAHANVLIEPLTQTSDLAASSFPADEERWTFAEIDLPGKLIYVKMQPDTELPADDPLLGLVRWRLGKWKKTTIPGGYRMDRVATAWPGGCLHFPSIFGPP